MYGVLGDRAGDPAQSRRYPLISEVSSWRPTPARPIKSARAPRGNGNIPVRAVARRHREPPTGTKQTVTRRLGEILQL